MKIQLTSTRIANWIALLLILAMIVLLFTPYWTYETKEKNPETGKRETVTKEISISEYVWFPKEHRDMTKEFKALYPEIPKKATEEEIAKIPQFWINDLVLMPALVLLLGLVIGAISLWYSDVPFSSLLALALGGLGAYSYITRPEFWLGNPMPHIVVSFITAGVGLIGLVWFFARKLIKK